MTRHIQVDRYRQPHHFPWCMFHHSYKVQHHKLLLKCEHRTCNFSFSLFNTKLICGRIILTKSWKFWIDFQSLFISFSGIWVFLTKHHCTSKVGVFGDMTTTPWISSLTAPCLVPIVTENCIENRSKFSHSAFSHNAAMINRIQLWNNRYFTQIYNHSQVSMRSFPFP